MTASSSGPKDSAGRTTPPTVSAKLGIEPERLQHVRAQRQMGPVVLEGSERQVRHRSLPKSLEEYVWRQSLVEYLHQVTWFTSSYLAVSEPPPDNRVNGSSILVWPDIKE